MLNQLCDGLWAAEHDVRLPGGVIFRSRMTVVDLGDGELLIHSPVPLDEASAEAIESLGTVRWIVAPNDHHHLFVGQAAARFPAAEVLGSSGARENESEVDFDRALEDGAPEEWDGRLDMLPIEGTKMWGEFVFLHRASRTLLCADLVFNIHDIPNLATHIVLWLVGARRRFTQTRSERWLMVKDREAYAESVSKVLEWDFDRVVMGHGRVVDTGGHRRLAEAVSWAVGDATRRQIEA
jgi:glyoxylase-like metal-dependent hydrolase (beta-lactamase superfamily II)